MTYRVRVKNRATGASTLRAQPFDTEAAAMREAARLRTEETVGDSKRFKPTLEFTVEPDVEVAA